MPYKDYEKTKASVKSSYQRHKAEDPTFMPRLRETVRRRRYEQKLKVFEYYGGRCAMCGISDYRVLDIDHKNDDGHKEGRDRSHVQSGLCSGKRKWEDYQLLCANCNRIKYYEWMKAQGKGFIIADA